MYQGVKLSTNLWLERWKDGKMERWKDGKMERWKDGKMERWKDGKMERYDIVCLIHVCVC